MIPKLKGQKKAYRLVFDYRKLNEKSLNNHYPLPNINQMLHSLNGAKVFATPFTVFVPFGVKNGATSFQKLMDHILAPLQGLELFC